MKSKKIFINQNFIKKIVSDDTFYDIQNKCNYNNDDDDELIIIETGDYRSSGHPIEISKIIEYFNSLKDCGCTHAEIGYHVDHREYELSGFNISNASQELINNYEKENKNYLESLNKIEELEKEILNIKIKHNNNFNPSLL